MNRLLLFVVLLISASQARAQYYTPTPSYLFVKKGAKKKQTYTEGDVITIVCKNDSVYSGRITLLYNDTIYLYGRPFPRTGIRTVLIPHKKNKFPLDWKTAALITAGSVAVAGGLMLNGQEKRDEAWITGFALGYGGFISQYAFRGLLGTMKRKKYRIGSKYRLQVLDFHLPGKKGF